MAMFLDELVTQYGMKKENLKILDVAAGQVDATISTENQSELSDMKHFKHHGSL